MNKSEAEEFVEQEIKKRKAVDELVKEPFDDLVIEGGRPSPILAPIGDGKIIFRTLAGQLNNEAREYLLEEINKRMAAVNHTIVWKLKYALDKAEFARTHVLTEDLGKVEKFLRDASRLTRVAIADFQRDADAYRNLAALAKEIKQSETEGK